MHILREPIQEELDDSQVRMILDFTNRSWDLNLEGYNEASLRRRLQRMMVALRVKGMPELVDFLSRHSLGKELFIKNFSVRTTEMFREPEAFYSLKNRIFPTWKNRNQIRILMAGCSTGEEVVSLAILLREHGLLAKATIKALDLDQGALERAAQPSILRQILPEAQTQYRIAGGQLFLNHYYTNVSSRSVFSPDLLQNVFWKQADINDLEGRQDYDLVWCKNLLIYFKSDHQAKLLRRLHENLAPRGYLALGLRESLSFYEDQERLHPVDEAHRLYQSKR